MKDNFDLVNKEFSFSMLGDPDCGCLPADGAVDNMFNYPNMLDFPAEGRNGKSNRVKYETEMNYADGGSPFGPSQVNLNLPNAPSSSAGSINASTINSALNTATGVLQLLGSKRQLSEVETVCGKQPHPLIGGAAKKQAWASCASSYMASKNQAPQNQGLSTGAILGITFGSIALVGIIIYAVKKSSAPATVVVQSPSPVKPNVA